MPKIRTKTGRGRESTQFKPGVSGNPNGRPKTPEELKVLKEKSNFETQTAYHLISTLTQDELLALRLDPSASAVHKGIAKFFLDLSENGSPLHVKMVTELAGITAPKEPQQDDPNASPPPAMASLTREEVVALLLLARKGIAECNSRQSSSLVLEAQSSQSESSTDQ